MGKLISHSFIYAGGTLLYVAAIAWFLYNGERLLGNVDSFALPMLMLLLFMVSALITASLVLGRPILLYLEGSKKAAIQQLGATIAWLVLFLAGVVIYLITQS